MKNQNHSLLNSAAQCFDYLRGKKDLNGGFFKPSFSSLSKLLSCNLQLYKYIFDKIQNTPQDELQTQAMQMGTCIDRYLFEYCWAVEHDKPRFIPFETYEGALNTKLGKANKEAAELLTAAISPQMAKHGFEPPQIIKDKHAEAIYFQADILKYQKMPNSNVTLYDLLAVYSTHVQMKLDIRLPNCFWGNCTQARGVIDAYGFNPETGRTYLLDLKKMPKVDNKSLYNTTQERHLSMQLAMYKKGLEQKRLQVDDCYIVALDNNGNSNLYQFTEFELMQGWQNAEKAAQKLDELIEFGEPHDLLKSYTGKFD